MKFQEFICKEAIIADLQGTGARGIVEEMIDALVEAGKLLEGIRFKRAMDLFKGKQWEGGLRLDRCTQCGECESRCPNGLPVRALIRDAQSLLYD